MSVERGSQREIARFRQRAEWAPGHLARREGKLEALAVAVGLLLLAGCASGSEPEPSASTAETSPPEERQDSVAPPPPPDAGTRAGHAADPVRVAVPDADESPPSATALLQASRGHTVAKATQPGTRPHATVSLLQRRVRGTMVGTDAESGVARLRVSLKEWITCRRRSGGREVRPRLRYFPPPQVERIRAAPGARIPTRGRRSVRFLLGRGACPAGTRVVAVRGELWGDVTNGLGLEAVAPHIRFRWMR